jgi:hypothetical protein
MFIILAIFMLALSGSGHPDTRNLVMYIGIFFLVFAAIIYWIVRRTRLVLSDDGIKLHQFGYMLETDWDNVESLYDAPGNEGLVLHRPMDCRGAFRLAALRNTQIQGARMYSDEQIQFIGEHRFIPISPFAYWLKKGQLRDDLAQRAPTIA